MQDVNDKSNNNFFMKQCDVVEKYILSREKKLTIYNPPIV